MRAQKQKQRLPFSKRFKRILIGGGLLVGVVLVGIIVTAVQQHWFGDDAEPKVAETQSSTSSTRGDSSASGGVEFLGLPRLSDAWAGQEVALLKSVTDQDESVYQKDEKDMIKTTHLPFEFGPVAATYRTIDALFSPTSNEEEWGKAVADSLGPDAADSEAGLAGDMPLWYARQRRFDPDSLCGSWTISWTGEAAPDCETWEGNDEEAIKQGLFFGDHNTAFSIPQWAQKAAAEGLGDPATAAEFQYQVVYVPMDDGVWAFTTACGLEPWPAHEAYFVDLQGNEATDMTQVRAHPDQYGGRTTSMGFGTVQHPCVVTEITVPDQKPSWYIGE